MARKVRVRKHRRKTKNGKTTVGKHTRKVQSYPSRGWAVINLKNGKAMRYELDEREDGYYFDGKRMAALRNWMLAERKAHEYFSKIRERIKREGKYKGSYSSMWSEPPVSSHNYSYKAKKPMRITPLSKYGMKPHYLGFEVKRNIKYNKETGRYEFEQDYYVIEWYPTTPETLQITKSTYVGGYQKSKKKLSKVVTATDKAGVKKLVEKFKNLYQKMKRK